VPIYDDKADPKVEIARALGRAREGNKRVLIIYGGNWCGWCYRFQDLLDRDPSIGPAVREYYEVVHVEGRLNPRVGESYGARITGYPYLTVLETDGRVVCHQETGVLEEGRGYKPAEVLRFLMKHRPGADAAVSRPAAT